MSKYLYPTVYERFTGEKPPEPQEHHKTTRRHYGHPYRMNFNRNTLESSHRPDTDSDDPSREHYHSRNRNPYRLNKHHSRAPQQPQADESSEAMAPAAAPPLSEAARHQNSLNDYHAPFMQSDHRYTDSYNHMNSRRTRVNRPADSQPREAGNTAPKTTKVVYKKRRTKLSEQNIDPSEA